MNILEIGIAKGKELGLEEGKVQGWEILIRNVESAMKNFNVDMQKACEGLGTSVEEYDDAKQQVTLWRKEHPMPGD